MHADIFCRVIDNFGDIGVTWRLVRQLQREHKWSIRLWVDDLKSFQRIEPDLEPERAQQTIAGVEVVHWCEPAPAIEPRPIVIASFSCELPASYLSNINAHATLWLNLEYLSAEKWVEGCHTLPSLRSDGLSSHFFFPGFTPQTGGLIREQSLLSARDAWRDDPAQQYQMIKSLGVPDEALRAWRPDQEAPAHPARRGRLISLFCYPQAPLDSLLDVLSNHAQASVLLVPQGVVPELAPGILGSLHIVRVPFVSQDHYDRILWTADLNVVRGEDSIVRAIWAGKPFIWHIYPQSEQTHLKKLEAWLSLSVLPAFVQKVLLEWNREASGSALTTALKESLTPATFEEWRASSQSLCEKLIKLPDLATSLDTFCRQKHPLLSDK